MSSTSSPCSRNDKEMMELRQNNERLHLTTCSLISQNKQLRKSSKQLRQKLIVSRKEFLRFKIDQTNKQQQTTTSNSNNKITTTKMQTNKCKQKQTKTNKQTNK